MSYRKAPLNLKRYKIEGVLGKNFLNNAKKHLG